MTVLARSTRRRRTKEERRQIVEETMVAGASVAVIARAHDVNANQVFHWRKLYREGRLDLNPPTAPLMPVRIAELMEDGRKQMPRPTGAIHIELGRAHIRVEGVVDAEALRTILEQLSQ